MYKQVALKFQVAPVFPIDPVMTGILIFFGWSHGFQSDTLNDDLYVWFLIYSIIIIVFGKS